MMSGRPSFSKKILTSLIDLVYPPACVICGKAHPSFLCEACQSQLKQAQYPKQQFVSDFGDWIHCALDYTTQVATVVKTLKYSHNYPAAEWIARYLLPVVESFLSPLSEETVLIPVPISFQKQIKRGYNQCELIAESLTRFTGFRSNSQWLLRKKSWNDQDQIGLYQKQRKENPSCQFETRNHPSYSSVLLLDDICTTGKTLYECKRAIHALHPDCQIHNIVFAHSQF